MKLGDSMGNWSEELRLNNRFRNDFKSGAIDIFYINLPFIDRVTELSIHRDGDDRPSDLW